MFGSLHSAVRKVRVHPYEVMPPRHKTRVTVGLPFRCLHRLGPQQPPGIVHQQQFVVQGAFDRRPIYGQGNRFQDCLGNGPQNYGSARNDLPATQLASARIRSLLGSHGARVPAYVHAQAEAQSDDCRCRPGHRPSPLPGRFG